MKKFCSLFLLVLCFFAFSGCQFASNNQVADLSINMQPRKISTTNATTTEEVVKLVTPAVVGISAVYANVESVGSGVCVAPNGYILTNHHVVSGASTITVYFANKTSAPAKLIWQDSAMDLAIIQVAQDLPYLSVSSSENLSAGQDVIAIGTPLTLQFKHTTTKGIVSALNRTIEIDNEDGSVSYLQNLIQHDSSINPGNSGGPLINANGEVVGINTLKVTEAEGLGFAIPIEVAVPVLNKIVNNGNYQTPYLGLFGFDANIAKFYNKTLEVDGVYILNIDNNGPASLAGLREGDVITQLNDLEIKTMLDLRVAVYNFEVNDVVTISYLRNGKAYKTNLTFTKRPN